MSGCFAACLSVTVSVSACLFKNVWGVVVRLHICPPTTTRFPFRVAVCRFAVNLQRAAARRRRRRAHPFEAPTAHGVTVNPVARWSESLSERFDDGSLVPYRTEFRLPEQRFSDKTFGYLPRGTRV